MKDKFGDPSSLEKRAKCPSEDIGKNSVINDDVKIPEMEKKLKETEKKYYDLIEERNILSVASALLKDGGIKAKIIRQYIPVINKLINKYLSSMEFMCQFELDEEFNETITVYRRGVGYKGRVYLLINSPYYEGSTVASLEIDLEDLTVNYLENTKADLELKLTNSSFLDNVGKLDLKLYSEPRTERRYLVFGTWLTVSEHQYTNTASYPGMFYIFEDPYYVPVYIFSFGQSYGYRLEQLLLTDIMSFYSTLRNKLTGTLLGQIDFGKVLDYDSKRYMIASSSYNLKKSFNEVTLLQISDLGSFLLNEDGTYILTEDGNKISL